MRRSRLSLIPFGLALMTGGCMGTGQPQLESSHQPVVTPTEYALDLAVSGGRLAVDEDRRLDGWARNLRLGYGDRVAIEDPAGDAPGAWRDVAAVMERYGLLIGQPADIARAPLAPSTVRVVVTRLRASVPGCPDASSDAAPADWSGQSSSNYGCAVNRNLAAMVANPSDLVHGVDGPATADPAIGSRAVNALRAAAPTGNGGTALRNPNAAGGGGAPGGGLGGSSGVTQ